MSFFVYLFMRVCLRFILTAKALFVSMHDFYEDKSVCFNFSTEFTADLKKLSLEKENQKF